MVFMVFLVVVHGFLVRYGSGFGLSCFGTPLVALSDS